MLQKGVYPLYPTPGETMQQKRKVFSRIADFCAELRPIEDLCYIEHTYNDQLIPLAKRHKLLGMPVHKQYGGLGLNNREYANALALIAREGAGIRTFFSGHTSLGQKTIQEFGSKALKEKYLRPSTNGGKLFAFALTEPEAGSNPLALETTYKEKGNTYILNGVKYLISNSGIAHAIIVFARGPNKKISAFVVDADSDGIAREDLAAKMGMPTTNTGMFELCNVVVPKQNLIGKKDDGWNIAKHSLMNGRLSVAAGCIGVIQDCLQESAQFAKERFQHGKVIARHQLVQEHLSSIKIHLESTKLMVEKAASFKDQYEAKPSKELLHATDTAITEAKLFASNAAWDAADRAVQVFGGRGWSFLYRPGRHLVDTRVCRIYEGTDEILKLKIAASLLGEEYSAYS
ncbi:MAG: Acyl-CoA dehydrogenase [Chlamydiae bacterium]|nr:Acyl-CoA dehydrogenase [Chlamydiota bacterium]